MLFVTLTCFIGIFAFSQYAAEVVLSSTSQDLMMGFQEILELGLQVIPERASITYANESYVKDCWANVRRYSRRGIYYLNLQATTLHTWGNNITLHLIFYEYLHNEYKRSFVEMHFKTCDLMQKEPYIGKAIQIMALKRGIPCPAPPGKYALMNLTVPMEDFPNVWPFEKSKVEVILQQTPTNDIVVKGEVFVTFKQPLEKSLPNQKS